MYTEKREMDYPEEEKIYFFKSMYEQYRELNRETNNRIYSINYLFIIVNIFVISANYIFLPNSIEKLFVFSMLPLAGIVSCFFWRLELKNLLFLNDISFKILMDMEKYLMPRKFKEESPFFEKLWYQLGDVEFRRSPLRTSPNSLLYVPVGFILIHIISFITIPIFLRSEMFI